MNGRMVIRPKIYYFKLCFKQELLLLLLSKNGVIF